MKKSFYLLILCVCALVSCTQKDEVVMPIEYLPSFEYDTSSNAHSDINGSLPKSPGISQLQEQLFAAIDTINNYYITTWIPMISVTNSQSKRAIAAADANGFVDGAGIGAGVAGIFAGVSGGIGIVAAGGIIGGFGVIKAAAESILKFEEGEQFSISKDFCGFGVDNFSVTENNLLDSDFYNSAHNFGLLHNVICINVLTEYSDVCFSKIPAAELYDKIIKSYIKFVPESAIEKAGISDTLQYMVYTNFVTDCRYIEAMSVANECLEVFLDLDDSQVRENYIRDVADVLAYHYDSYPDLYIECLMLNGMLGVGLYSSQLWEVND